MASGHPALTPEIGPDGLARDSPVIAYTEKVIEAEQLQLKKYIQENYSKIRDVEKELESLTLEMKLTAGPKKAALEHLRKKIETATEKVRLAKHKEEQAKKAWEAAEKALKEEEAEKQKLCDDLNRLVQESAASQYSRLEELKKRLEALNPCKTSTDMLPDQKTNAPNQASTPSPVSTQEPNSANVSAPTPQNPTVTSSKVEAQSKTPPITEAKEKRRPQNSGRGGRGSLILSKGRGNGGSGWTGAGFDVDLGS